MRQHLFAIAQSIFTVITDRFFVIFHVFHPPDILTVFSGFGNLIVLSETAPQNKLKEERGSKVPT